MIKDDTMTVEGASGNVYDGPFDYYNALRSGEEDYQKTGEVGVACVMEYYRRIMPLERAIRAQALLIRLYSYRLLQEAYTAEVNSHVRLIQSLSGLKEG